MNETICEDNEAASHVSSIGGPDHNRTCIGHGEESEQDSSPSESGVFEDDSCAICLEEYKTGESLLVLPCRHCFHGNELNLVFKDM